MKRLARLFAASAILLAAFRGGVHAQDVEVERPAPPALDDFETDENHDGVPDGWYNARDMVLESEGGKVGPHCLKFETRKPSRPARLSRAFGVDGKTYEAIEIGVWIRLSQIQNGERLGEEPGLIIDFLGEGLRGLRRGTMGPWTKTVGPHWTRVVKRIPVPPESRDAIMSVGLLGASGILEVDGITIELIPDDGEETNNLIVNGGFELGDPAPAVWIAQNGAHRVFPGARSKAALELPKTGSRAFTGVSVPVEPFGALAVSVAVKGSGLRGAGGAGANLFFLDDDGNQLSGMAGSADVFRWSGSFDWRTDQAVVPVPRGATRAVLQFEKSDNSGKIAIDDVAVYASPNAGAGSWTPYHVEDDKTGWLPVEPSLGIEADSALDASYLVDAPAGKRGFVTVRDGGLVFSKGGRARFFGVYLLPPAAFLEPARADALADRLARSGVNLVRLGDLDTAIGPDRSLFDDTREDTQGFDAIALAKLDHLIAALKSRGIYVALELQSVRRFRSGDGVKSEGLLPPAGGPAAEFDPVIGKLALATAKALLSHVNPETRLPLRNDPVLAWVTLGGEISLFDLIENPNDLPSEYQDELRQVAAKKSASGGRRLWQSIGAEHWTELAAALRKDKVRVPIAGVSHWRRDPEFSAQQATEGLDLVDDRLYWTPPPWINPGRRSLLWSLNGGLAAGAARKRNVDRPYVVGQWCHQTRGAWALPYEAADVMLAAETAVTEDWDALVRRGVFVHPEIWGSGAAGTGGVDDVFQIPEVVNGLPQVFSLWPHAASIMFRGHKPAEKTEAPSSSRRPAPRRRIGAVEGWDPASGRLVIETPYTQGIAGWPGGQSAVLEHLTFEVDSPYAVVVASSAGTKPIASSNRLLVSAVARVQPTGFRWVDENRHDVAEPGRAPLLREPVQARVLWRRTGKVKAFALDNSGKRIGPVELARVADGVQLTIDGSTPNLHWELVAE